MNEALLAFLLIGGFLLLYIVLMFVTGYLSSLRPLCPPGYRAISVDGSRSIVPKNSGELVRPTDDYPTCAPVLSCPTEGQVWAFKPDGSALTNTCETPNCPCTAFQHCPAYVSTVFRQFGADERISLYQVIDTLAKEESKPKDPYDTPYMILPGIRDTCFLSEGTINLVWPKISLGDKCLRGTLAKLKTNPSIYLCAPTSYVSKDFIFDVDSYMSAYRA